MAKRVRASADLRSRYLIASAWEAAGALSAPPESGIGEAAGAAGVCAPAVGDELLEAALSTNTSPKVDVPTLLAEYFEAIRRVQPHGPYHLAGVSFGGVLAYELARALRAAGETIGTLALLDPVLPSSIQTDRQRQLQRHLKTEGIMKLGARDAKIAALEREVAELRAARLG